MDGRINPPSSLHKLDAEGLRKKAEDETLLLAKSGELLAGCLFVRRQGNAVYLGKLAIDEAFRGKGLGRQFIDVATMIAKQWSCEALELETRVELHENQAFFEHLGFAKAGENAHEGFDRPTSFYYRKMVE
jgi:GNAT superfamily N-acetyltransferase